MTDAQAIDGYKRAAAIAAVADVRAGMIVGLGTGSTAAHAITALAERVAAGLRVQAVATSQRTEAAARAAGIAIVALDRLDAIDMCIDGVDEIDPALRAIKGAGGAMLVEKIVASMARRNVAIADGSKRVERLGARAVPLEVLPRACGFAAARVAALGGEASLRMAASHRFVTDSGNAVLDCRFANIADPAALATALSAIPGMLGHGLFVGEIDALYIADADGVVRRERPLDPPR